jgi:hypothetical protein
VDERVSKKPRFGRRTRILLGLVAALVVALALAWALVPEPDATLVDIARVDELKARFNQDHGTPRLVLLVSPT